MFLELASKRYSVRDFSQNKVEDEKINLILEASKVAPTAANFQPQKIYVIKSDSAISKLAAIRPIFGAKLAFIICYDKTKSWKNRNALDKDSGDVDAAIITTHMMLEATELSLGSCWIGAFNPKTIQEEFNISETPVAILLVGYHSSEPSEKHSSRKSLEETTLFL